MKRKDIKNSSILHIQEIAHQKKSFARMVLQFFVWILVIAFVSTIGVMWDGQEQGFPVLIKTKYETVDISPQSFYMLERDRIDAQFKSNNIQVDPRLFNDFLNHSALSNTENIILQKSFFDDIKIKPSPKLFAQIQESAPHISVDILEYQYGMQFFNGVFGVLPSIATPTISDLYAYKELKEFTIVADIITLNKTNFMISQIQNNEINKYYQENAEKWAEKIVIQDFIVSNRGIAKLLIKEFQKFSNMNEGLVFLQNDPKWKKEIIVKRNKILTPLSNNYSQFIKTIMAFKNKNINNNYGLTEPIYNKGSYHVSLITNIGIFNDLSQKYKYQILLTYLKENHKKLSEKYSKEWEEAKIFFKKEIKDKKSFAKIEYSVKGSINNVTLPFSVIQTEITNITGVILATPIFKNAILLKEILNTPLYGTSKITSIDKSEEWLFAFRILEKNIPKKDDQPKMNFQQELYNYKVLNLQESFGNKLAKRYKLKTYSKELTNLNLEY